MLGGSLSLHVSEHLKIIQHVVVEQVGRFRLYLGVNTLKVVDATINTGIIGLLRNQNQGNLIK